jgi:uncharacterized membrane protein YjjP (DUF1212 family)
LNPSFDTESKGTPTSSDDGVEVLISFGASMWRAGGTAIRTREWSEAVARKIGFDAVALSLSLESVTASVRRSGERTTASRIIETPAVNTWRIGQSETVARAVEPRTTSRELAG